MLVQTETIIAPKTNTAKKQKPQEKEKQKSSEEIANEHLEVHRQLRAMLSDVPIVHFFVSSGEYGIHYKTTVMTFNKHQSPHSKSIQFNAKGKKITKIDFKKAVKIVQELYKEAKNEHVDGIVNDMTSNMDELKLQTESTPDETSSEVSLVEYNKENLKRLADKHSNLFIKVSKRKRLDVITGGGISPPHDESFARVETASEIRYTASDTASDTANDTANDAAYEIAKTLRDLSV